MLDYEHWGFQFQFLRPDTAIMLLSAGVDGLIRRSLLNTVLRVEVYSRRQVQDVIVN
jgi:hypothetical protein